MKKNSLFLLPILFISLFLSLTNQAMKKENPVFSKSIYDKKLKTYYSIGYCDETENIVLHLRQDLTLFSSISITITKHLANKKRKDGIYIYDKEEKNKNQGFVFYEIDATKTKGNSEKQIEIDPDIKKELLNRIKIFEREELFNILNKKLLYKSDFKKTKN